MEAVLCRGTRGYSRPSVSGAGLTGGLLLRVGGNRRRLPAPSLRCGRPPKRGIGRMAFDVVSLDPRGLGTVGHSVPSHGCTHSHPQQPDDACGAADVQEVSGRIAAQVAPPSDR